MSPSSTEPSHSPVSDDTLGELRGFVVPEVVPLDSPSVPIPPVIDTERALRRAADELAGASGPVAVDTERAQGIRYGRRAFLVQLKRDNKIYLIDPEAFKDLRIINDALTDAEWVIHAAIQDFPSLDMLGMRPKHLFDTELGARLGACEPRCRSRGAAGVPAGEKTFKGRLVYPAPTEKLAELRQPGCGCAH